MAELAPKATFQGCDIDGEAVSWCLASYPHEVKRGRFAFACNGDLPPAPFKSDSFDLVYGISVFTHLPEDLQLKWLAELRRVAKPDGLVVLSTSGDGLIRGHLGAEDRRVLDGHGFYYHPYGATEGLPEYYQATWHTRAYIERVWSRYFHVAAHLSAGVADHQDLVICVKRRLPATS
jgi:SAM-dependent methyltransferase